MDLALLRLEQYLQMEMSVAYYSIYKSDILNIHMCLMRKKKVHPY